MDPPASSPRIAKNVWTISAANFFIAAFTKCYMLLPVYMAASGVTNPGRIGWLMGSFYVSTFARPFVGWFTDEFGFRKVLLFSGALSALSGLGILFTRPESVTVLIGWRILSGTAYSLFAVSLTAYQSLVITGEGRGAGLSVVTSTTNLPYLLVVPACEVLLAWGLLKTYLLMPVLLALASCWVALQLPEAKLPPREPRARGAKTAFVMENPQVRMLLYSITLFCSVDAGLLSVAALGRERGISVSAFFAASAVTSLGMRFFGRALVDRLPRVRASWACAAAAAVVLAAAPFPVVRGAAGFGVCGALYGLFIGLGYPMLLALIGDVAPPEQRSRVTSLFWFFMGLSYLGLPVLTGYLAALFRYRAAFALINLGLIPLLAYLGLRWEALQKRDRH